MSPTIERLRLEILALPSEDRYDSIASVVQNREVVPLGLHPSWEAEIERRVQDFRDDKTEGISWEQVERELNQLIERP